MGGGGGGELLLSGFISFDFNKRVQYSRNFMIAISLFIVCIIQIQHLCGSEDAAFMACNLSSILCKIIKTLLLDVEFNGTNRQDKTLFIYNKKRH